MKYGVKIVLLQNIFIGMLKEKVKFFYMLLCYVLILFLKFHQCRLYFGTVVE